MVLLLVFNKLCSARLLPMMIKSKSAPSWIASKTWIMSVYWPNVLSIVLRNQGSQLAQRRCHNVMVRSKMRVVQTSVSDVVTTSLSDVIKTLPQRCCNVATTFSILLQTILISFPSSKRERVTKVLSGIKHTSSLFKRTLYL